jgi:H/ACA ribonucleoprotein complex subunit 4
MEDKNNPKPLKDLLNFSILNIDKPSGPTSFQVSQFVKTSLQLNKTSHFGTLDPKVTGVLPVALGRACKLNEYFMHRDKIYVGIMRLHESISELKLKQEMKKFVGVITQLPPVRSRVKRAPRQREVKSFELIEKKDKDVLFKAHVQAGTYIRTIIHDLGKNNGGAHMLELRRTKASVFPEEKSITLYEFESAIQKNQLERYIIPAEEAIKKVLPTIQLKSNNLKQLLTGKPLYKQDTDELPNEEKFAAFHKNQFIGIYKKSIELDKGIVARPEFVFN